MPDKVEQTPDEAAAQAAAQAATAAAKTGAEGFDIQAALDKMNRDLQAGLTGLRSLHDRKWNELRQQIARVSQGGRPSDATAADGQEPTTAVSGMEPEEIEEIRRDSKITRFLQDHPGAREHWADILKVINDEGKVDLITAYNSRGKIDYYKSYRNAFNEVLASKFTTAHTAAAPAVAAAAQAAAAARAQATTSGVGAEQETDLDSLTLEDIAKMTPEDMDKRGLTALMPGLAGA